MINFDFVRVSSTKAALAALQRGPNAQWIAGGTNLVDLMKKGILAPEKVVDINKLPFREIRKEGKNLYIGALAGNSMVVEDELVNREQPLLSLALKAGASQQIRNMATVGGNLLQRTRCPYFYNTDLPCNKRARGTGCGALKGVNRMHAIFGASEQCIAVHPSDMCVALAALDATVHVTGPEGDRSIPFSEFHRLPGEFPDIDTTLKPQELILAVTIPQNNFSDRVRYLKIRDRSSYAFALISVAVAVEMDGGVIKSIRLAMGGVAHKPWRLTEAEAFLTGKGPTDVHIRLAAKMAMEGARAYGYNNFKLTLAPNTLVHALKSATANS